MKKIFIFFVFFPLVSSAQITVISPIEKSITITPNGVKGSGQNGSLDTTNVAIGQGALVNNKLAQRNIAIGTRALSSLSMASASPSTFWAKDNVAIGFEAMLKTNPTNVNYANRNVAVGNFTLKNNIEGSFNTAIGDGAMINNVSGGINTAIGVSALANNETGYGNVAVGSYALSNANGLFNTAIGHSTLSNNLNGINNTAIGASALLNNTNGNKNIAIGISALQNQSYSNSNNTFDSHNLAIGVESLYQNNPRNIFGTWVGIKNLAIGNYSLHDNVEGIENIAIGTDALLHNTYGQGNIAIGIGSVSNGLNNNNNISIGNYGLFALADGHANTTAGHGSGRYLTSGTNNVFIGQLAGVEYGSPTINNSIAIGSNAIVNASNKAIIGNSNITQVGGFGSWTNYSDKRLKSEITYTDKLGLSFIKNLQTASYYYTADANHRRRDGLIAQDVQKVIKDLGIEFSGLIEDNDKEKTLNLSYSEFVIPLINSIKELDEKNQKLENELNNMKKLLQEVLIKAENKL